jgi:hypothetical protein
VSIIEGVAFVILTERAYEFIIEHSRESPSAVSWMIYISYILISFFNIIITTYLYVSQLSIFRRQSTIYDVVFPYLVGAVQIVQVHLFEHPPYWWLCQVLYFLLGIYAFSKNRNLIERYARKVDLPAYYRKGVVELVSNFRFLIRASAVFCLGYSILTFVMFTTSLPAVIPAICLIPIAAANVHTLYRLNRSQARLISHFLEGPPLEESAAGGVSN